MQRANQNTLFFKSENKKSIKQVYKQKDRIWLDLKSDEAGFSQILVSFSEQATDSVDRGYDALKFSSGNPISLYSVIRDSKYVIQGLSEFSDDKVIRLGFDTNVAPRKLNISLNKIEGTIKDHPVLLVDHLLKKVHDLNESCYHFEQLSESEIMDRFEIRFKPFEFQKEEKVASPEYFYVSNQLGKLSIESDREVQEIEVFDLLGRRLYLGRPGMSFIEIKLDQLKVGQIYMIRAILSDSKVVNRRIICQ